MTLPSEFPRRPLSCADVQQMTAAGILREDEHVELIAGELIVTPPQGPEHAGLVAELDQLLHAIYPPDSGFHVRAALPLQVDDETLPEPDLAVVRGDVKKYRTRHPRGHECLLVIEIARTSLKLDHEKAAIYKSAGVPEYWIVDVSGRGVERYVWNLDGDGSHSTAASTLSFPETTRWLHVRDLF